MITASLRQLEYFVAAVDTGTVTGAAQRCSASQAAVSAGLNDLEAALGLQVLVRRPAKGVALTSGGERVLPLARRMLADAADLSAAADEEQGRVSGVLRIACTVALSPRVLPTIAEEFSRRYPQVQLEFADGLATEMQDLRALRRGRCLPGVPAAAGRGSGDAQRVCDPSLRGVACRSPVCG